MRLSVCMIVRDEEADLPRCLATLVGAADELIVVDTGSQDRTPELALAAGATLVRAAWTDDFAAARNTSLDAATGDWCLAIDADEELPPATREALRRDVARADAAGLWALSIIHRNVSAAGQLTAWEDLAIVRLFRRAPAVRYAGRIHEQVSPAIMRAGGRIGASELVIVHHGYARATAQGNPRAQRNLALLERALRDAPDDAYWLYQVGATRKTLGDAAGAAAHLARAVALQAAAAADAKPLSPDAEAGARLKLAQLALARGDDAAALADAERCLALQPANATALQITVVGSIALGRLAAATTACRALLACANVAAPMRADVARLLDQLAATAE